MVSELTVYVDSLQDQARAALSLDGHEYKKRKMSVRLSEQKSRRDKDKRYVMIPPVPSSMSLPDVLSCVVPAHRLVKQ
jgi:hypothetical protein